MHTAVVETSSLFTIPNGRAFLLVARIDRPNGISRVFVMAARIIPAVSSAPLSLVMIIEFQSFSAERRCGLLNFKNTRVKGYFRH